MNQIYKALGDSDYEILTDINDPLSGTLVAKKGSIVDIVSIRKISKFLNNKEVFPMTSSSKGLKLKENNKSQSDFSFSTSYSNLKIKTRSLFDEFKKDKVSSRFDLELRVNQISEDLNKLSNKINPFIGISYLDSYFDDTSRFLYRAGISKILSKNEGLDKNQTIENIIVSLFLDLNLQDKFKDINNSIENNKIYSHEIKNKRELSKKLLIDNGYSNKEVLEKLTNNNSINYEISKVSDIFTGLSIPREFVPDQVSKINSSIAELYLMASKGEIDLRLVSSLIKGKNNNQYYLGKFHPGTILSFKSSEVGIVTRPGRYNNNDGSWISCPVVRKIIGSNKLFRLRGEKLVSNPKEINKIENPNDYKGYFYTMNLSELWNLK